MLLSVLHSINLPWDHKKFKWVFTLVNKCICLLINVGFFTFSLLHQELKLPLEKEMATHSSILAWKIPWTEEPGRLQSVGSHDWARTRDGGWRELGW